MDYLELYLARTLERKHWARDQRRRIREEKQKGMVRVGGEWISKELCIDLGNGDYVYKPK